MNDIDISLDIGDDPDDWSDSGGTDSGYYTDSIRPIDDSQNSEFPTQLTPLGGSTGDSTFGNAHVRSNLVLSDAPDFRAGSELTFANPVQGTRSEQIRKLRTEMLLRHGQSNPVTMAIAVVSSVAGEGRSVLAAELALSFAQLRRSTLLIDGDLRNPRLHQLFQASAGAGVFQGVVNGGKPALHGVEGYPALAVMTAGEPMEINPTELLSSGRFKQMIETFRNLFEFIIVDTPPMLGHSDGQLIASVLGKVLTVHRASVSSYHDSRIMLRNLATSKAEVLGAVLNHF